MAVILAVNMLVIGIFGSYQTAQAAEIVAGYTAGQILESILLGFGISIFTTEMVQKGTSAAWWDTDGSAALKPYYDDLEQAYEEQRFKVINGGGGQNPEPSPTPAPGSTPIPFPTTVPVPGDIPTFKELVAPALAGTAAVINMTQGAWECMGKAVSSLWDKIMRNSAPIYNMSDNPYTSKHALGRVRFNYTFSDHINTKDFYLYTDSSQNIVVNYFPDDHFTFSVFTLGSDGKLNPVDYYYYCIANERSNLTSNFGMVKNPKYGSISILSGFMPWAELESTIFVNGLNCPLYVNGNISNSYMHDFVKENIWVHPDLQDTYKNNGKLEYPQQAPQPLQIPSGEQLADTVKKLNPEINPNYSPEIAPSYIQELIQQLQKQPDPNPNPDPDPNPNPNPDPNPDPEVTPKPDEDTSNDIDPKNYTADLKKIFPFCIPFDLVHLIQAFEAEPEAPVFEFPFDLELENPWTGKKILDYHHVFKLDMSDYEPVIKIFRIFEIIFFIIGLLMITRQQMIKG